MNEQCRRGYHDFITKEQNSYLIISKCRLCGKVLQESATDNRTYMENHKRDFVQRGTKDFEWIYGENEDIEKKKMKEAKEHNAMFEEEERRKKRNDNLHQIFTEEDFDR